MRRTSDASQGEGIRTLESSFFLLSLFLLPPFSPSRLRRIPPHFPVEWGGKLYNLCITIKYGTIIVFVKTLHYEYIISQWSNMSNNKAFIALGVSGPWCRDVQNCWYNSSIHLTSQLFLFSAASMLLTSILPGLSLCLSSLSLAS